MASALTSCPRCDAATDPGARSCARCGYRFVEDGARAAVPPSLRPVVASGAAVALIVAAVLAIADRGNEGERRADPSRVATARLQIISERPLPTPRVERAIEELYIPAGDDDRAAVDCTGREAKPAHSVRRCEVRYPNGVERRVVVLTNARGNEVLSKP